jgi:hypothetical protein
VFPPRTKCVTIRAAAQAWVALHGASDPESREHARRHVVARKQVRGVYRFCHIYSGGGSSYSGFLDEYAAAALMRWEMGLYLA